MHQRSAYEWSVKGHGRGEEDRDLTPADAVIPYMKSAISSQLAQHSVRSTSEMMRGLEYIWDLFRYRKGEDKKNCKLRSAI